MIAKSKYFKASYLSVCLSVAALTSGHASAFAPLPVVPPVMACTDLLNIDWTGVPGAPIKLNSVSVVTANGANFCYVTGYVAPKVRLEMYMPAGWTQRYQFSGSGGYAGSVSGSGAPLLPTPVLTNNNAVGFPMASSNELVVVFSDLGHARAATAFADGFWALNDPTAIVDFAYTGVHKSVLASKAIVNAYYGQQPRYSYFNGCSDGGREGLHELQRFPADFDGAIIGAPVIDEISTNSQWHAYFWRSNQDSSGRNLLLTSKQPVLRDAVRAACSVRLNDGTLDVLNDFRSCHFDAQTIASPTCDPTSSDGCLTPAQATVANNWWSGVIANGEHLTPGGAPYGSEFFWGLPATPTTPVSTLGDFIFSNDFPNIMASFAAPTGLTGRNLQFTAGEFDLVHALTGIYDPTSPDLTAFQARGGKIIFWQGWADSGASPYMLLNYINAMAQQMGTNTRDSFTKTYMIPGAGHCGASKDLYSPLLNWVEQGQTPGQVNVTNIGQGARDRPVWPHPSLTVYNPAADSFVQDGPSQNSDLYLWRGLSHYMPSHTTWCSSKGASTAQQANLWVMSCGSLRPNTP